jgi:hypothetical protein
MESSINLYDLVGSRLTDGSPAAIRELVICYNRGIETIKHLLADDMYPEMNLQWEVRLQGMFAYRDYLYKQLYRPFQISW